MTSTGKRHALFAAAVLALVLAGPRPAAAQEAGEDPVPVPVRVSAEVRPETVLPGGTLEVRLTAEIAPGHHIYGLPPGSDFTHPTTLSVVGPPGFVATGQVRAPAPSVHVDDTLGGEEVEWFTGKVTFEQDVSVPSTATPGTVSVTVKLDCQACTDQMCFDAETLEVEVQVTVAVDPAAVAVDPPAAAPGPDAGGSAPPEPAGQPEGEEEEEEEGLLGLVLSTFLGGLGSLLLPCIYPLIPLTVAFFAKHEGSRASAVSRAILFCLGIVLTFTALGVALGPLLQVFAGSLLLNAFLFLLMVVLALSLLGMFDLRLPSSWTEKMQAAGSGASFMAPVFMGVAFSLASFTCTVGVIGPLLATSTGDWAHSAVGMFSYSLGFAVPFFVLALFPVLLSAMPRGGGWMNTVKVMLGFFEICFAGYYLWRMDLSLDWGIGTRPIILSLWTVTVLLAGVYLLGKIRLPHDPPSETVPVPRLVGSIVTFGFGLFLFAGLMNQVALPAWVDGLLPPKLRGAEAQERPEFSDETFHTDKYAGLWWTSDYDRALEIGKRTNRRIFLNFTGIACSNCRTLEAKLWPMKAVQDEFEEMVLVELWTDILNDEIGAKHGTGTTRAMSDRYRELRRKPRSEGGFGTTANPHYVILSPEGKALAERGYDLDADEFVEFLQTGK